MVSLARRMMLFDRIRFFITVSGVAFAVTLVLVQVGLFWGLLSKSTVTIDNATADLWITSKNTPNIDFSHTYPATSVLRVRSVPGVARADNVIITFMEIQLPNGAQEGCLVYALDDFTAWNLPWNVTAGEISDVKRGSNIFMDESAARRFGPFRVGEYREIQKRRFRIIGTTRDAVSFTTSPVVFMDRRTAEELSATMHDRTTYTMVKLLPGADPLAVKAEIRRRLPYNDVYTKLEWAVKSRNYWITNTGLGLNMGITVFLGILVGLVIVAQTLYTAAVEHLREFGTVKAIGGSNWDIYRILGEQALMAAVLGFALGGLISLGVSPGMSRAGLQVLIQPGFAVAVFFGTVVMCLGAALLSFRRVASIDPALVFRT